MQRTPKDMADHLVHMYGTSTNGMPIHREDFEKPVERHGVDHRLIRSIN